MTFEQIFSYGTFAAIGLVLWIIALGDARKYTISLGDCFLIIVLTALYKSLTNTLEADILDSTLTALAATAFVYLIFVIAKAINKRPPILEGDAWLFAATGFLLGSTGFLICVVLNLPLALAYRHCLIRKRKSATWRSYAPVAPSFCIAALMVFGSQLILQGE